MTDELANEPLRVLLVQAEESDVELAVQQLRKHLPLGRYEVVDTARGLRAALEEPWDIVLSDDQLPTLSGLDTIRMVGEHAPHTPVILLSRAIGEELTVQAIRAGAIDYVHKDRPQRLGPAVLRGIRAARTEALAELQRAEMERMRRLKALGQLAAGIAHDFNNLLTVVHSYSALMEAEHANSPIGEDAKVIRQAAQQGAGLTRQLLTFANQQPCSPEPCDPVSVVGGLVPMLRRVIRDDVRLTTCLEGHGQVLVHPSQLEQIVMNLVVNARDAMPSGGHVHVEVSTGPRPGHGPDPYRLLVVRDTGAGMPPEVRDRVFEPFFTTKGASGTGLGLSTVHGIVLQHGGWIDVQSNLGEGTIFRIGFPLHEPTEPPAHTSSPSELAPKLPPLRILVVDDNPFVAAGVARVLQTAGHTTRVAAAAETACNTCRTWEPNLIIADVRMPDANGVELVQHLRACGCTARALYMSGYAGDEAGDTTAIPVIFKPFEPETLLAAVARAMA